MKKSNLHLAALGLALTLAAPAFARPAVSDKAASSITMMDRRFMRAAANGGAEEVRLGKLAASRASSPQVRAFGEQMVVDHTKVNHELKLLADKKGVELDKPEAESSDYKKLAALKGKDFDREYVKLMVDDHEKDVKDFDKQSKKNSDPNLSAWCSKTLPTLKHHLSMIQQIHTKI
jgi:putative membrane protein